MGVRGEGWLIIATFSGNKLSRIYNYISQITFIHGYGSEHNENLARSANFNPTTHICIRNFSVRTQKAFPPFLAIFLPFPSWLCRHGNPPCWLLLSLYISATHTHTHNNKTPSILFKFPVIYGYRTGLLYSGRFLPAGSSTISHRKALLPSWQGNNKSWQESAETLPSYARRPPQSETWHLPCGFCEKFFAAFPCNLLSGGDAYFASSFQRFFRHLCFNCNICLHGPRVRLSYLFAIHFAALEKLHMLHPYSVYSFQL